MTNDMPLPFDPHALPSPCYVLDADGLRRNAQRLHDVRERSGAAILLALKAFAMPRAFPLLRPYLDGTTGSSLNEVRLAHHEFGREIHAYAVAWSDPDFDAALPMTTHVTFNSLSQWHHFRKRIPPHCTTRFGLRINPQYSEVAYDIYNPCIPGSRLGMTAADLEGADLDGLTGLHSHTLCEQGSDTLERTVAHIEARFAPLLHRMRWLNLGGGHHITKNDYDRDRLVRIVRHLKDTYHLHVILEPGEAVAQEAGWLISEVLDVFDSDGVAHAILDTSATAHMPDVLEMPYRPDILDAGGEGEKAHTYRLGGVTCLTGDRIGAYSFDRPLHRGDRLAFTDMAMYTLVKSTHFNGIPHPAIALWDPAADGLTLARTFGYDDFRNRLG